VTGIPTIEPAPSDSIVLSQSREAGGVVVRLAGDLDLSVAAELRELLQRVVRDEHADQVVLDFAGVRLIDAHSIGLIMTAWRTMTAQGRQLRVAGLRDMPARLFDILGLAPLLGDPTAHDIRGGGGDDVGRGAGDGRGRGHAADGPPGRG